MTAHVHDQPLWAKGGDSPPTVEAHCRHVCRAVETIWAETHDDLRRAFGPHGKDVDDLLPALRVVALLHDVGKANNRFQAMLSSRVKQPVRHEVLSALVMNQHELAGDWLRGALGEDFWPAVFAVGGHHLELRRARLGEVDDPVVRTRGVGSAPLTLYLGHPQVQSLFAVARNIICDDGGSKGVDLPDLSDITYSTDEDDGMYVGLAVRQFLQDAQAAWREVLVEEDHRKSRRAALLKALLIAADVAGSAVRWRTEADQAAMAVAESLSKRLEHNDLLGVFHNNQPRAFQDRLIEDPHDAAILVAGCGSGKTLAAYLRANARWSGRKLFFCYPTTGTASAGYREYLLDHKNLPADLRHSRASVDLAEMHDSPETDAVELARRADVLHSWGQKVLACTVDQVLGLVQNNRRPLFAFPAIAAGAIVFDEIHSYDDRLFGGLLRFLKAFPGMPVLLMTASLPPNRAAALKNVLGDRVGDPIRDESGREQIKRYRPHKRDSADACWVEVAAAISRAEKVMWVCNTVADAQQTYRDAQSRLGGKVQVLLYHSRYRYRDRVKQQDAVVAEFAYADEAKTTRTSNRPSLVVATQVCEMSLDLSADLLVTAQCPLPSLVQRMGRLNRYGTPQDKPRPCLVYPWLDAAGGVRRPYHESDAPRQALAAWQFVEKHDGKPVSQEQLADAIAQLQGGEDFAVPLYSAWLDGGWQSEQMPTRAGSNSITIVREEDVPSKDKLTADDLIPLTIPMLLKRSFQPARRIGGFAIAAAGSVAYDEEEGASWAN